MILVAIGLQHRSADQLSGRRRTLADHLGWGRYPASLWRLWPENGNQTVGTNCRHSYNKNSELEGTLRGTKLE